MIWNVFLVLMAAAGAGLADRIATAETLPAPVSVVEPAGLAPTRTALTVTASPRGSQTGSRTETVFTAHVTDAAGNPLIGNEGLGTVSFETGAASLGSAALDADGNATISVSSLPVAGSGNAGPAALAVHAVFHPSTDSASRLAASASAPATVQPEASGVPDYSITANPATLTATAGDFATTAITITPSNGFSEQVSLSCAGLPAQATCNFSPVVASTASGPFTSTLEIETQAPSGALTPPQFWTGAPVALAWLLPGAMALAGLASLRRRALSAGVRNSHRNSGLVLLVCVGVLGLAGCSARYGYIHHPPSVATGTPTGTYVITINAAGNNGSAVTPHSITVTLQVQ